MCYHSNPLIRAAGIVLISGLFVALLPCGFLGGQDGWVGGAAWYEVYDSQGYTKEEVTPWSYTYHYQRGEEKTVKYTVKVRNVDEERIKIQWVYNTTTHFLCDDTSRSVDYTSQAYNRTVMHGAANMSSYSGCSTARYIDGWCHVALFPSMATMSLIIFAVALYVLYVLYYIVYTKLCGGDARRYCQAHVSSSDQLVCYCWGTKQKWCTDQCIHAFISLDFLCPCFGLAWIAPLFMVIAANSIWRANFMQHNFQSSTQAHCMVILAVLGPLACPCLCGGAAFRYYRYRAGITGDIFEEADERDPYEENVVGSPSQVVLSKIGSGKAPTGRRQSSE